MPDVRFQSRYHPGDLPLALVFTRALLRPLAACLLPLMVVTLVLVLQGYPILTLIAVAYPTAALLALGWTHFRLRRLPATLRVTPDGAALTTVWEAAHASTVASWARVLDLRDYGSWCLVTLGLDQHELARDDWPDYPALRDALEAAYRETRSQPY